MKKNILILLCLWFNSGYAQLNHDFYFGGALAIDKNIKDPGQFTGNAFGEWHFTHDQIIQYFQYLDQNSGKVKLAEYGRSYENRPLYLAFISSEENISDLGQINKDHLDLVYNQGQLPGLANVPVIVWLGHSVHGNEPSGANASMLTAYYLVASQSDEVKDILNQSVVIIDPCLNPDGYSRFNSWVNMQQSKNTIDDQNSIQFNEPWPRGRTNHYWFDLNRDWLVVQHPESKARLKYYHQWKPMVLTDHHEMEKNGTFFFQPGVPSRVNPNTPAENYTLNKLLGSYYAKTFDRIGTLYFSEESFDDFYYGKGSSYPDATGAIGILFEQASVGGQLIDNSHGPITFAHSVRNQFKVAISTVQGTIENKDKFQDYQSNFYSNALALAKKNPVKAYAFGCLNDKVKMFHFLEILLSHQIEVYANKGALNINNKPYKPGEAFIVPLNQYQYRLIKSMFEIQTNFTDSIFYDISTGNLALSFNLDFKELLGTDNLLGKKLEKNDFPVGELKGTKSQVGYVFQWTNYNAPKVLYRLLQDNILAKVATRPFQLNIGGQVYDFGYGSVFIPVSGQALDNNGLFEHLKNSALQNGVDLYCLENGVLHSGVHLGSSDFEPLGKPKILMLTGDKTDSRQVGEIWHLLDYRLDIPVTRVNIEDLPKINLFRYNTLILPDGKYELENEQVERIRVWLNENNNMLTLGAAAKMLDKTGFVKLNVRKTENYDSLKRLPYATEESVKRSETINGVILEGQADMTHPVVYGYNSTIVPVFKDSDLVFEKSPGPFDCPVYISKNPLMAGSLKDKQKKFIENSAYILNYKSGNGNITLFSENPNFRAYWYGTNRLFVNALFFGPIIR